MFKYVIAAAMLFAAPAFAQDHSGHMGAMGAAAPANDPAYAALKQADEKMMRSMGAITPSGNPDVDFVRMMISHHQGAIDMAEAELKFGKDESRRKLAQEIIAAQTKEIAEMKDWLAKNAK